VPMHEGTFATFQPTDHATYKAVAAAIGCAYQVLRIGDVLPLP